MNAVARGRRPLRRLALVLASLAIALGAAELLARTSAPEWLRARMREVAVGRSLRDWGNDSDWPVERDDVGRAVRFLPGSEFTIRDDEYVHRVRIDDYGGRVSGRASVGMRRTVPVLGDSMTFGLGVRDEETWVSLVGRSLPVRLVNLALPGTDMLCTVRPCRRTIRASAHRSSPTRWRRVASRSSMRVGVWRGGSASTTPGMGI
jgi:hypothetical protein